jgi:hypothetical protein
VVRLTIAILLSAVLGADHNETATKMATMVRTFGHAQTEVCGATGWKKFKELVRHLPPAKT